MAFVQQRSWAYPPILKIVRLGPQGQRQEHRIAQVSIWEHKKILKRAAQDKTKVLESFNDFGLFGDNFSHQDGQILLARQINLRLEHLRAQAALAEVFSEVNAHFP